jgi:2-iminoacetate synthase ThiH
MSDHSSRRKVAVLPRLPLAGSINLTFKCNNNCRHCWLRVAPDSPERKAELTAEEVKAIVEETRARGCRKWSVSRENPC